MLSRTPTVEETKAREWRTRERGKEGVAHSIGQRKRNKGVNGNRVVSTPVDEKGGSSDKNFRRRDTLKRIKP